MSKIRDSSKVWHCDSTIFDECIRRNKYDGKKPTIEWYKVKNGRRRVITPEEKATAISLCIQSSPYESATADYFIVILADTGLRLGDALKVNPRTSTWRLSLS